MLQFEALFSKSCTAVSAAQPTKKYWCVLAFCSCCVVVGARLVDFSVCVSVPFLFDHVASEAKAITTTTITTTSTNMHTNADKTVDLAVRPKTPKKYRKTDRL